MVPESEKNVEQRGRFFVKQSMTAEYQPKRQTLLKEFFLNATMIVLIDELADEYARLDRLVRETGIEPDESWEDDRIPVPAA